MREFVALEDLLRPRIETPVEATVDAGREPVAAVVAPAENDDLDAAIAAARRFRAALAEALERAVETMVQEIAASVLARELALAPVDLAAIVDAARRRFASDEPLRVRAHPGEINALAGLDLTVVADPSLRRGDVELDLRDGSVDATLGARLERVLLR